MKVCSVCLRCYEDSARSCSDENHDFLTEARAGNCEVIPNYRLEFLHETSAAGETYRAVNTILNKPYLVKTLAPGTFDEATKKQFLAEAQSLAAIIHPNVARVFESGVLADGSLYVVTEYFTAQTLRECLENVGAPSEVTALTITRQAAEGLEALHAAGVLHRGIRPENLILTADAENKFLVKLQNIDFGGIRQKQVNTNGDLHLSELRYFSPEQCEAKDADAQTDVYGMGVVLYEILAGKVPFDAPYADALIAKQTRETPPEVKIKSFDLRMLLTHTLTDALQKTTRTRLKTANALTRRIRHIEQLATHSSTPPPAMSYPAKMDKAAVVFTPPAKPEKIVEAEKEQAIEIAPAVETQSVAAELPVIEAQTAMENSTVFEIPPPAEDLPVIEIQMVEETPAAAVELQTPVEDAPFAESRTVIEDLPLTENETVIEDLLLVETQTPVESAVFTETPTADEDLSLIQDPTAREDFSLAENEAVIENVVFAEIRSANENPVADEIQAEIENTIFIENKVPAETPAVFENGSVVENTVLAEPEAAVKDLIAVKIQAADENPDAIEILSAGEESAPDEIEIAAEKPALSVRAFDDYSTTKLPPLEAIIENRLPRNIVITEITPIFSLKSRVAGIHKTSQPALIEWQQPDDVPTTTQALNPKKKALADTVFAADANFNDDADDIIDAGEVDSAPQNAEPRRNYAAEHSVFSYEETAAKSWNLPGKRTILTGAAIAGFLVLAVGGTFLNRQIQSAGSENQTAEKSAPNDKTLPKSAEPVKITETEKPTAAKTDPATASNPALTADNPELPNYQPRDTEEKTVVPVSPTRTKKRAVSELSEKRENQAPTKTVSNEVFDKQGKVKPAADKKTAVKNQAETPTKGDIFTRPRVVKNPKF